MSAMPSAADRDRVGDWIRLVEARYPRRDAQPWDAPGLQVGDPEDRVHRVLVCLDVTATTLAEATDRDADLVLAHHPLLFRPLGRLTTETAPGRLALAAARAGIAIHAAHTNLDAGTPGTTDPIVDALGLDPDALAPLERVSAAGKHKLVTFVPAEDTERVLGALSEAGAGVIGAYDHCGFRVRGTGSFRPSPEANPHLGDVGAINEVTEDRLEVELAPRDLERAVAALWQAHPYEEVAYDVYPLEVPDSASGKGLGRVGELPEPRPLRWVADRVAGHVPAPHLQVAGDLDQPVQRIAALGGSGDGLIGAALAAEADCYITGDLRHHPTLDARTQGLALIDAGHGAVEGAALPRVAAALAADARTVGLDAEILTSAAAHEPWAEYRPAAPEPPASEDPR